MFPVSEVPLYPCTHLDSQKVQAAMHQGWRARGVKTLSKLQGYLTKTHPPRTLGTPLGPYRRPLPRVIGGS